MYPADLPPVEPSELTSASLKYLSSLESGSVCSDWFHFSSNSKLAITTSNVRKLQLFKDHSDWLLLVLHLPDSPHEAVALYLSGKWWHVNDVLKTSEKSRNGLNIVKSTIERVQVLVLSQLVDRAHGEEQLFSNFSQTENCKLLWAQGEAVGFYSFKHKGSLCENCISQSYELPVLDTIFVRSHCRRKGFGLKMLEDFSNMFPKEETLGISSPLSANMVALCKKYLIRHEEHRDVLYEVEAPGSWMQRRNIWLNIQLGRYTQYSEGEVEYDESRSSEKLRNLSAGETSPNCGHSKTTQTLDPHCGPPIVTEESPETRQALKWKGQLSVDQDRKEVEGTNPKSKRIRRT